MLNLQARKTLGTIPIKPMGVIMRDSRITPVPVALDASQRPLTARLASACEGSKKMAAHDHHTSGTPICRVITK